MPCAKIANDKKYSIVSDYIGRPTNAFDEQGNNVWEAEFDIYGRLRKLKGDKCFVPFRQLGQYEDEELDGVYYNRFRYYDNESGGYISKDPIGLNGGIALYGYVEDANKLVDVFGLNGSSLINGIPQNPGVVRRFMSKAEYKAFKKTGFKFDPLDSRGGISTTSTSVKPKNPDAIRRSTGALGADYYVDIDVSGKNVELKGRTKGGVPDWKIKDNVNVDLFDEEGKLIRKGELDIVGQGRVYK